MKNSKAGRILPWVALACLVVPMFASYYFDDMFSSVSQIFKHPETLALGWNSRDLGDFIGDYSLLCICGGLIVGGILLDLFGVRIMGSIFLAMMVGGGALAWYAVSGDLPKQDAIALGRVGRMLFGLGSEIAGVAVTRSIAKWFKEGHTSLAMGLQLAIARAGTAVALITAPLLIGVPKDYYSIADTARPAKVGLILLLAGAAVWAVFVAMDASFDRNRGIVRSKGTVAEEDKFKFKDILSLFRNPGFVLIGILCVTFYCCVSSFKKFGTSVIIPRFGIEDSLAGTMISMIPFFTIVFTPLFGFLVDKFGKAANWMVFGSGAVLSGHLLLAFAPQGVAAFGFIGIALLGLGYSLVPSAMWPSVPKIVPEKSLGTAYSLIYWIQNVGLFFVPKIVGGIFAGHSDLEAVSRVEYLFISLGAVAVSVSLILVSRSEVKN